MCYPDMGSECPPRKVLLLSVVSLVIFCAGQRAAQAATITFNSLELAGSGYTDMNSYTEAGFTFTSVNLPSSPVAFQSAQQGTSNSYAGSAGLALGNVGDSARLSAGGLPFSMFSIDLSREFDNVAGSLTVLFTGFFVGGGSTSQSFTFSQFGFVPFSFNSTFTNLDYVDFGTQTSPYFQIDNVAATTVPEPATIILLSMGLAGVAVETRRRHRRRWRA